MIAARAGTVRRLGIAEARELQLERERPRSREWCTRTSCPRRQRDLADGLGLTSGVVLGVLRVVERQRREPRGLGGGCAVGTSRGGCEGLDGGPVSDSGGQLSVRAGAARARRFVLAAHLLETRHNSPSLARPGAVARSGQGERRSRCLQPSIRPSGVTVVVSGSSGTSVG